MSNIYEKHTEMTQFIARMNDLIQNSAASDIPKPKIKNYN